MRTSCNSFSSLRDAIDVGGTPPPAYLIGALHRTALGDLVQGSAIASGVENLRGRSALIASADPFLVAAARRSSSLMDLARRARHSIRPTSLCEHLPYVMGYAEVDAVVSDGSFLSGALHQHGAATCHMYADGCVPRRSCQPRASARPSGFCSLRAQPADPRWCCTRWPVWQEPLRRQRVACRRVLEHVLRHSSLRRPSNLSSCRADAFVAVAYRAAGAGGELPAACRRSRRNAHLRHTITLAAGAHEPRSRPHCATLHPALGRDRRSGHPQQPAAPSIRTPRSATPLPPRKPALPSMSATNCQDSRPVC